MVGGDNLTQVVASWATTYGIVGNGSLQLGPAFSTGNASLGPPSGAVDGGSFAIGATVGIVAAGKLLQHFLPHAMWRCAHCLQHVRARAPPRLHLTCQFLLPHSTAVVAVLAVLGLLIWRRHKKRQLRRKPVPLEQGSPGESKLVSVAPSALALHGSGGPSSSLSDRQGGCCLLRSSRTVDVLGTQLCIPSPTLKVCRCSDHLSSDPVLSYIASRLASVKPTSRASGSSQVPLTGAGSVGSGGSGNIPGLAEWQVDWSDIKVERQIGRGAYGRVSLPGGIAGSLPASHLVLAMAVQAVLDWAEENRCAGGCLPRLTSS